LTGEKELLWEEQPVIEDYKRMFWLGMLGVNLNYKCDEMVGVLAPTDSRFRPDQRLLEEGLIDESDEEKIRLEIKQRAARKLRSDQGIEWVPNFFKEIPHPFLEGEKAYEFSKDNDYWQRRQRGDWQDLPELW